MAIKDRLPNLDKTTIFISTSNKMSESKLNEEYERVTTIVTNNLGGSNGIFTGVTTNGMIGIPSEGKLTVAVTFYT